MAFDFKSSQGTNGYSQFDDGPDVPKRKQGSRGGFHMPQAEKKENRNHSGGMEQTWDRTGRELENVRPRELDRRGSRRQGSGFPGMDIPWRLLFLVLVAILVVALLVAFWDVIYAMMVNILSFLLMLIILIVILRLLLRW